MDRIFAVLDHAAEYQTMNGALIVAMMIIVIIAAITVQFGIGYAVFRFALRRPAGKAMSWAVGLVICAAGILLAGRTCFLAASTGTEMPSIVCGWRCNDHREYQGHGKSPWYGCWGKSDGARRDHIAAERGHAEAQAHLGLRYGSGFGVSADQAAALSWYRKAADQDVAWAQYELGRRHMTGKHHPTDYVQAYKWLSVVGSHEGSLFEQKSGEDLATLEPKMTSAEITEAQRFAREWQRRRETTH